MVSALSAGIMFCTLLRRVEDEHRALVIDRRGPGQGIRNYARLAGPGAEVLRFIAEESKRKGTDKQTSCDIDQEIKAARAAKRKRG